MPRHLATCGCAVAALERVEDPPVLLDRHRVRARTLSRPDRVHRERAAEGGRDALESRVVRGSGQQSMKLPRKLARIRPAGEGFAGATVQLAKRGEIVGGRARTRGRAIQPSVEGASADTTVAGRRRRRSEARTK